MQTTRDHFGLALRDPGQLVELLLSTFRSPQYEPPVLPAAAMELLSLSKNPNVSPRKVLEILEKDPLIAARVLRLAQSAFYRTALPVQSLHQALVRLGLTTLAEIFAHVAFRMTVFRSPMYEEPMERLRKHSTATAYIARVVCKHTSIDSEHAFLAGLLHDVGIVAALVALSNRPAGAATIPFGLAWPAIQKAHEQASGMLCDLYKLSPDVVSAVGSHHSLATPTPLAAVLTLSDWVAAEVNFGFETEASLTPSGKALALLNISDEALVKIVEDAKLEVARLD